MRDKDFIGGFVEGVVAMTASIAALYIGTNLGLKARNKLAELEAEERIDIYDGEVFEDEDPEL